MSESNRRMSVSYGLVCLALGGLWLLHSMELLPWRLTDYLFSWRFLLVLIGGLMMIKNSRNAFGIIVFAAGLIGTATYFWHLPEGWETFLPPIALIIVGLILVLRPNPDREKLDANDPNVLNRATILGKYQHTVTSMLFKGGYLSTILGQNEIDFTSAHLGKEMVVLQLTNVFGSTELRLPQNWELSLEVKNVLGATSDIRQNAALGDATEGILVIR